MMTHLEVVGFPLSSSSSLLDLLAGAFLHLAAMQETHAVSWCFIARAFGRPIEMTEHVHELNQSTTPTIK